MKSKLMNEKEFQIRNHRFIKKMGSDKKFKKITNSWIVESVKHEYSYHFIWFGIPIIQYPQDMIAYQEIIWQTKPDLIIETGIARGGSLIFSASLLEIIGRSQTLQCSFPLKQGVNKVLVRLKHVHVYDSSLTQLVFFFSYWQFFSHYLQSHY